MASLEAELAEFRIPFDDIVNATNDFAKKNLIKRGAKADFYKGVLTLHWKVEIDVVIRKYRGIVYKFSEKINRLARFRHKNVASFIGFCDEALDQRMIVMKHEVNGSLDKYLSDPTVLTWSQRLHICFGAALALRDRGGDDDTRFEILLDNDWEAKVQFCTESKTGGVYCLGVILLEVLYGRKLTNDDVNQYITHYEEEQQQDDDMIDPDLKAQMHPQSLAIFSATAYDCLKEQPADQIAGPHIADQIVSRAKERLHIDEIVTRFDEELHINRSVRILNLGVSINQKMKRLNQHLAVKQTFRRLHHHRHINQTERREQVATRLKEALEIQCQHKNLLWMESFADLKIPLKKIMLATENFAHSYRFKSYADVYKAQLSCDDHREGEVQKKTIIIKRFNKSNKSTKDFFAEIEMLISCSHCNLSSFLGFCEEDSEMLLVFENDFRENLQEFLRRQNNLTWEKKLGICLDIAQGLKYLHNIQGKASIIHQVIRSKNVFLDDKLTAKIANFQLYDDLERELATSLWQSRREKYRTWLLGPRLVVNDMYSLGVILFEILTEKLDHDLFDMVGKIKLHTSMRVGLLEEKLKTMADPKTMEKIIYQCLTLESLDEPPTFEDVINSLKKASHVQCSMLQLQGLKHLKIPLEDIKLATRSFDKSYCIGSGGYGEIYKAELKTMNKDKYPDMNHTVAIKRIKNRNDDDVIKVFFEELDAGRKCKHPNVISFHGFCIEDGELLLVYELASNGSLENYLESSDRAVNHTWTQRLKISIDIAHGLKYMHTPMEGKETIIHRDIKSANILLGNNWEAKIADFGLCKVHLRNQTGSTINTKNIAGTKFYRDPEYVKTGRLKKASDIYSFGVVLFEIFTGKLAYDGIFMEEDANGLAPIAQRHFENHTLNDILDSKLMDEASELGLTLNVRPDNDSLDAFSKAAYQCLERTQDERPTIEAVICDLKDALHFQEHRMKSPYFSLENIRSGVGNFNDNNCIMRGGYMMLYKGTVQDNNRHKKVIIKRFIKQKHGNQKHGFLKEFEALFKYKHDNIIDLIGYCNEMDEKIIVYEYASKGCLSKYLKSTSFSWTKRLNICIDIANGLNFLHGGVVGQDVLIHRDVTSSNILLTEDWKAKICGFDLSLTYPTNQETGCVLSDVGSRGYCDPFYSKTKILTTQCDIYSFGVVLFEILCGRLACPEEFTDHIPFLDVLVKHHFQVAQLDKIVFEGIKKEIILESFDTFQRIALQCLHEEREERPTAGEVLVELQKALKIQEDYEIRKAKLQRTYKETLHRFSHSPESYSSMRKRDIYNRLSKEILLKDDKLITHITTEQMIWDLEQLDDENYYSADDEDYCSEPDGEDNPS